MNTNEDVKWDELPAEGPQELESGMHLWAVRLSDQNISYQSEAEALRCIDIKDAAVRLANASAQGGLRRILSAYRNELPREIALQRTERGKPYVTDGPEFNLSHTRSQIFVVVSQSPVGLDVEAADRPVRARELAEKFFHPAEQALFATGSDEERRTLFLRMWVCKEAIVKLSGDGITHGLKDARLEVAGGRIERGYYQDRAVELWQFRPEPGFIAAVASWQKGQANSFFRI
jgi:4'-phosphopantetheinyl transferase